MDLTTKGRPTSPSSVSDPLPPSPNRLSPHHTDEIKLVDGAKNNEFKIVYNKDKVISITPCSNSSYTPSPRSILGHIKLDIDGDEEVESSPVQCTSTSGGSPNSTATLQTHESPGSVNETITQQLKNMTEEDYANLLEASCHPDKPSQHTSLINQLKHSSSKATEVPTVTLSNSKYSSSLQSLDEPPPSASSLASVPNPKCSKSRVVNKNGWDQGHDPNSTSDHEHSPPSSQFKTNSSIFSDKKVGTRSSISSTRFNSADGSLPYSYNTYTTRVTKCAQTQPIQVMSMSFPSTSSSSSSINNYSGPHFGKIQYPNTTYVPRNLSEPLRSYMGFGGGRGSSSNSSSSSTNSTTTTNSITLENFETDHHNRSSFDGGTRRQLEGISDKYLDHESDLSMRRDMPASSHVSLSDDYHSVKSLTAPAFPRLDFPPASGSRLTRNSPHQSRSETPTLGETASASLSVTRRYEEKRSLRIKKQAMTKEKEIVVPDETRKKTNEMYKDIDELVRFIGGEEEQTGKKKGNGRKGKRKEVLSKSHSLDENALGDEVDQSIETAHSASSTSVEKKSGDTDKKEQEVEEKRMKDKNSKKTVRKKTDSEKKLDDVRQLKEAESGEKTESSGIVTESFDNKEAEKVIEDVADTKQKESNKVQNLVPEALSKNKETTKVQVPVPVVETQKKDSTKTQEVLPEVVVQKKEVKGNTPGSQKKDIPKIEQRTQNKDTTKSEPVSQKKELTKPNQPGLSQSQVPKRETKVLDKNQPIRSTPPPSSPYSVQANTQEEKLVNGLSSPRGSTEFITVTNRKKNKFQKPVELPRSKSNQPVSHKADPTGSEKVLSEKASLLKPSHREPLSVAKKPQSFELQTIKKTDFKLGNKSDTYASHVYTNSARKLNYRAGSLGSVDVKSQHTAKNSNPPPAPTSFDLESDPPLCPTPKQTPYRSPWGKSYVECARTTVSSSQSNPVSSSSRNSTPPAQIPTPAQQAEPPAPVQQAEPPTPVQQVEPPTPVQQAESLTSVQQAESLTSVQQAESLSSVQQAEPPNPVQQAEPSNPVQQVKPLTLIQQAELLLALPVEQKDQTKEPVEFCGVNFDNKSEILAKPDVEVEFGFGVSDVLQAGTGAFNLGKSEKVQEENSNSSALLPDKEAKLPKLESEIKLELSEPVSIERIPEVSPAQTQTSKPSSTPVINRGPPVEQSHYKRGPTATPNSAPAPENSQSTQENYVPPPVTTVFNFITQVPAYPGPSVAYPYTQVNMITHSYYPTQPGGQQPQIHIQQTTGPIMSTMPSPTVNTSQQPPQHQVPPHQVPQHQVPMHQVPQHQAPQHPVPQHQVPQHQVPQHQVPQHQVPQHQVPQHQVSQHQAPQHQVPQHQVQMHPHTQHHAGHPGNAHGMAFHPPPHYQPAYNMNHNMIITQGQPGQQQVLQTGPSYPISIAPVKQSPSPLVNSNMNPYMAHYQPPPFQNFNRSPNQPVTPPALIPNMNQSIGQNSHYMPNPNNQNSPQVPVQQSPQGSVHVQHNLPHGTYPVQQASNMRSQPPPNQQPQQQQQQQQQPNNHTIDLSSLSNLPRNAGRGGRGGSRRGAANPHYNNERGNYRGNNGGGGDMGYRGEANPYNRQRDNPNNHYCVFSPYASNYHYRKFEESLRHREAEPEPELQSVQQKLPAPSESEDNDEDNWITITPENPLSKYYREAEPNEQYEQYAKDGQQFMDKYVETLRAKAKKGALKTYTVK